MKGRKLPQSLILNVVLWVGVGGVMGGGGRALFSEELFDLKVVLS